MARLRDGGSGDPALWMRARQEAPTDHEKQTLLVRLWEAEELIEELKDRHVCLDCESPMVCPLCDDIDHDGDCESCGINVAGPVLCQSCFEDQS